MSFSTARTTASISLVAIIVSWGSAVKSSVKIVPDMINSGGYYFVYIGIKIVNHDAFETTICR
jgi:hypothetical protein